MREDGFHGTRITWGWPTADGGQTGTKCFVSGGAYSDCEYVNS